MKRIFGLFLSIWFALVGLSAILFGLPSSTVMAEQPGTPESAIVVNTMDDELNSDGDCSLREAIFAANDNIATDACPAGDGVITDTIIFDVAGTIIVTDQLTVTAGGPLVIDGARAITISGGDSVQILSVGGGADLTLEELTLVDGEGGWGTGGISNYGIMTVKNSTLSGNSAYLGGGIGNSGIMTVTNSTLSDNSANYGGGIYNTAGMLIITNSTISGNSAVWEGGAIHNNGRMTVTNSNLSGNTADIFGGGIWNRGIMTVTNSTLSDNSANYGGGISNGSIMTVTNSTLSGNSAVWEGGAIHNNGTLTTVTGSTLSGNSAVGGGSIYNMGGQVTAGGSVVANSPSGGNCAGNPINDAGYNIEDTDTCGFDPANGSMPNTDPLLGPLQDNGGPTFTHALLEDSLAIDAGDPVNCPPTDQRGIPRPVDGDGDGIAVCDIGAYEFQPGIFLFPNSQSGSGVPSTNINYNIQLYNWTSISDTYSLALGSHTWDTELSESQVGPLEPGGTTTFTVTVLIPVDSGWYETDSIVITATSMTSPTVYSDIAQVTTQAYAPAKISVEPLSLASTQSSRQIVTQTLTISNGNGVTLTFAIYEAAAWLPIDPVSGTVPTSGAVPIMVVFDSTGLQPGTYTITLSIISNDPLYPAIDVPVIMTVVPVTPATVTLSGPATGWASKPYKLTAMVEPITTTLPLTYTWQASGQALVTHTGELSDTAAFTWPFPGTQHITVTASNDFGTVMDTHAIAINDVPIAGLVAANNSPTPLGAPTTFTATVEAGTNISYAWDFGDDFTGSRSMVTHTYTAAGVYTATVIANNSAGNVQAGTVVTVVISETRLYLPIIIQTAPPSHEAMYRRRQELIGSEPF